MNQSFFLKRLREPSSLAGLSTILVLAGMAMPAAQAITNAIGALAGALAFFLPDR